MQLTWQFPKCYTSTCQFSLEGEFQPPRRYRMRSKGSEADLSEDALPFSLWEGIGQKWGHKEAHFESLPGPEELKTVNEGSKRAGYFFFPNFWNLFASILCILPTKSSAWFWLPSGSWWALWNGSYKHETRKGNDKWKAWGPVWSALVVMLTYECLI